MGKFFYVVGIYDKLLEEVYWKEIPAVALEDGWLRKIFPR